MPKLIIIGGYSMSLVNFRGHLIKDFVDKGYEVIAMAPELGFEEEIAALGARFEKIPLHRTGINSLKDLFTFLSLLKKIRALKPEIVFLYTIKPVIYGSLIAKILNVPRIYSMITGLGYVFVQEKKQTSFLKAFLKFLYKKALKYNNKVFFQNPDDLQLFVDLRLVEKNKTKIINGSGVDTEKYYYFPPDKIKISFLLIARLLWDKGIKEYVEAARIVKNAYPQVSFKLLGPFDSNPSAISSEQINSWVQEGSIEYLDKTNDVRSFIQDSSIYVLPSYREGTPRSVLEAMSMGRAVITTDAPGCKETVKDEINGFLVPVKNIEKLAQKMNFFIENPDQILTMGKKSREIIIEKYDVHKVNKVILKEMGL